MNNYKSHFINHITDKYYWLEVIWTGLITAILVTAVFWLYRWALDFRYRDWKVKIIPPNKNVDTVEHYLSTQEAKELFNNSFKARQFIQSCTSGYERLNVKRVYSNILSGKVPWVKVKHKKTETSNGKMKRLITVNLRKGLKRGDLEFKKDNKE